MTENPFTDFEARIKRINSGVAYTKGTIFVGVDGFYRDGRVAKTKKAASARLIGNFAYPISIGIALLLGVVAGILGCAARFHLNMKFGDEIGPATDMAINCCAGVLVGYSLLHLFRLRRNAHFHVMLVNVIALNCLMHNLVHWQPKLFDALFSPNWVYMVLRTTEAHSIMFFGYAIPI